MGCGRQSVPVPRLTLPADKALRGPLGRQDVAQGGAAAKRQASPGTRTPLFSPEPPSGGGRNELAGPLAVALSPLAGLGGYGGLHVFQALTDLATICRPWRALPAGGVFVHAPFAKPRHSRHPATVFRPHPRGPRRPAQSVLQWRLCGGCTRGAVFGPGGRRGLPRGTGEGPPWSVA